MFIKGPFLLASLCMAMAPLSSLVAMPIYKDGHAQAVVVIPDRPSPITLHAGTELVEHLNRATGEEFKLKKEAEVLPREEPYRIYVGASKAAKNRGLSAEALKKNEYIVYPAKDALYLVGNDDLTADPIVNDAAAMGSLLAVYDWLDHELGVRWIWPGETGRYVPLHKVIETKDGEPRHGRPAFFFSNFRFFSGYYNYDGGPSRYGRTKGRDDRSFEKGNEWLRRQKIVRTSYAPRFYGHAFGDYWKRFGKTHPEWFALRRDGKREPADQRTNLVQLCLSNPELHEQIIRDWMEQRTPERPWVNACPNDRRVIDPFCSCDACKAWDVQEALVSVQQNPWHIDSRNPETVDPYERVSKSDRYARFMLALLQLAKKHDPDAKVVGYAYSFYSDAPVKVQLNSDVVIIYVPPYVYPLDKGKERMATDLWDRWRATGATMIYRPNDLLIGDPVPYIYPTQIGRDFKHYLDTGLIATDFDSLIGSWGTQAPTYYMLGRLHARPDLTPEQIMEEYYSTFDKATETIREYVTHWERVTARADSAFHQRINGGHAVMTRSAHLIFTPETFEEGEQLLAKAAKQVEDDTQAADRVKYLQTWLLHAKLCSKALEIYNTIDRNNPTRGEREQYREVIRKINELRKQEAAAFDGVNWPLIERRQQWLQWQ